MSIGGNIRTSPDALTGPDMSYQHPRGWCRLCQTETLPGHINTKRHTTALEMKGQEWNRIDARRSALAATLPPR